MFQSENLIDLLNAKIRANYHSIREAANIMGINQSQLSQILRGKIGIGSASALKTADYLNITPEKALTLAGHADLVPLLNNIAPKSKIESKEKKISYTTADEQAGHASFVPLLNDIAPKSKTELKEKKISYTTADEQEEQLKEIIRLFSQLPTRDKYIWIEQLRTYVKSITEIKIMQSV